MSLIWAMLKGKGKKRYLIGNINQRVFICAVKYSSHKPHVAIEIEIS